MSTLEQKIDIILEAIASDSFVDEEVKRKAREALARSSSKVTASGNADVNTDDLIVDLFKELGISPNLTGYKYAFMAVKLTLDDPDRLGHLFNRVYSPVASKYGTTPSCVERCIRIATHSMFDHESFENITDILGNVIDVKSGGIKNGEFIASCVREITHRMNRILKIVM